jgi:hypothetical protein
MYKPLYIPDTILASPVEYGSALLRVPVAVYTAVEDKLAVGDWTYLQIKYKNATEIIRVIGRIAPDTLVITRHIDDTDEQYFPAGATLSYTATVSGAMDSYVPPAMALTEDGAIEIANGVVSYPNINLATSLGLLPVGSGAHLSIARDEAAYGCCDGDNAPEEL